MNPLAAIRHQFDRVQLARELLREYEAEHARTPEETQAMFRALLESGKWAVETTPGSAERWRESAERAVERMYHVSKEHPEPE